MRDGCVVSLVEIAKQAPNAPSRGRFPILKNIYI